VLFLVSLPLFVIFCLLVFPSCCCILILFCYASDQCTSERARPVQILWGGSRVLVARGRAGR